MNWRTLPKPIGDSYAIIGLALLDAAAMGFVTVIQWIHEQFRDEVIRLMVPESSQPFRRTLQRPNRRRMQAAIHRLHLARLQAEYKVDSPI